MIDSAKKKSVRINVGAQQVAIIYAKALLGAAEKLGQTDSVVTELRDFVETVLDGFPKLEAVFASALVSQEEKVQLLDRVFGSKVTPMFLDFLKVLSRHGRLEILRAIEQEVSKLYDELRGRVRVQLSTATALETRDSGNLLTSLRKLLGGEPQLESVVDPALIGGVVLRVGDTVYDGSVAWQLDQVREQMINRSVHEIQSRRDSFRLTGGN